MLTELRDDPESEKEKGSERRHFFKGQERISGRRGLQAKVRIG
jgi:hypothetical protein